MTLVGDSDILLDAELSTCDDELGVFASRVLVAEVLGSAGLAVEVLGTAVSAVVLLSLFSLGELDALANLNEFERLLDMSLITW